ncbi:unnamed protein product [Coffea canephora]|uniref:Importin N-terminal domain-containing protein n=1 Tax=Coffea canephora TaxID=49390 RepID=A0A068TS14_COFCA|nr:unnamed protein product [Coffea canephora]
METHQIAQLLHQTLGQDASTIHAATDALDALSTSLPDFPFCLVSITTTTTTATGIALAAATYLKNFVQRNCDTNHSPNSIASKEFKDALMRALLGSQALDPSMILVVFFFRPIVAVEFVKNDSWPQLVPELREVIQDSDLVTRNVGSQWKTVHALTVFHSIIRPFQQFKFSTITEMAPTFLIMDLRKQYMIFELYYFLNPKLPKEPVPPQLELIAQEILVPILALFHQLVEKVGFTSSTWDLKSEKILLIVTKSIHFAPIIPLFFSIFSFKRVALNSIYMQFSFSLSSALSFKLIIALNVLLKTVKRSLNIFCVLVTRHRKFSDKLIPDIINSVLKIVKHGAVSSVSAKLLFDTIRIISLASDVISRVLETGRASLGWRLVSPHFTSLLDSAIFPTLVMNEKVRHFK